MICPICEVNEATVSVVKLDDYTTQQFCVADFARFGLDFARGVLEPDEILEALGIVPSHSAAEAVQDGQEAPKGRKRPKPTEEPQPTPEPAEGPPEVAAATPDE